MYGQSKAAGDLAVANAPRHYILRSSWVIGEGRNFVKTMMMLSNRVADPGDGLDEVTVVDDQYGRLTFTSDMADAIFHLLDSDTEYGTYDLTGSGRVESWAGIARMVFDQTNGNGDRVRPISTGSTSGTRRVRSARARPIPALDLKKIEGTGYSAPDWEETLKEYVAKELAE